MKNKEKPPSGSPQSGATGEHTLWEKGATARKQKESCSFERLSCSLARIATPERTYSYVSIHDGGFDTVIREIARSET